MFCVNCGKQIGDGKVICEACEAAKNLPYDPQSEPGYQPQQPVNQRPVAQSAPEQPFELNHPVQQPQKTPKKKKGGKGFPVGGVVAAVLLVAIAVTAVFCWDAISSFFVRSFAGPEDYMSHVEEKAAEENINSFTNAYGQMLGMLGGGETEKNAVQGEIHLQIGDELLNLIEMGMASSGMDVDMGWLSDIKMTVSSNVDGDLSKSELGIGLGKTTIATISMIMNMGEGDMYMGIPELSDTYLYMNMEDAGMDMSELEEYQDIMAEIVELLPSEEKLNEVLVKYLDIVLANVQDVEKSTETVEVDDVEQKLNVISCTITEEDLLNIAIAILEDVQKDDELMEMIIGIVDYVGSNTVSYYEEAWNDEWGYYESVPVYSEIDAEEVVADAIDSALENLEDLKDEADDDNCINMTTYVDNADKIVGRIIEIEGDDIGTVEISYITVWQKDEFAFEANIADAVEITGAGSREQKLVSGEYEITVDGEDILTLEVEDYDEKAAEEGYINGTFTLVPSDEIMDQLANEMGASVMGTYLDFAKLALEVKLVSSENANEVAMSIKMGGATLFGISINGEYVKSSTVKVPGNTVDMDDQEALMEWVMDMDFDQLIENLEDAGVADMLIDAIVGAVDSMGSYDDYYYPEVDYYG